jgi:hypothetical protein
MDYQENLYIRMVYIDFLWTIHFKSDEYTRHITDPRKCMQTKNKKKYMIFRERYTGCQATSDKGKLDQETRCIKWPNMKLCNTGRARAATRLPVGRVSALPHRAPVGACISFPYSPRRTAVGRMHLRLVRLMADQLADSYPSGSAPSYL